MPRLVSVVGWPNDMEQIKQKTPRRVTRSPVRPPRRRSQAAVGGLARIIINRPMYSMIVRVKLMKDASGNCVQSQAAGVFPPGQVLSEAI